MKKFYNCPEAEINYINSSDCITVSGGDRTAYDNNSLDQDITVGDWAI
ncbi:MAG: hypothetical protein IJY08_06415 [Clostridia bacterium]|nr:hypothetical protein [Clostridia bacterium]